MKPATRRKLIDHFRGPYQRKQIWSSPFLSIRALLILRIVVFAYTLFIWITAIVRAVLSRHGLIEWLGMPGGSEFIWFTYTHLTHAGLLLYLGSAIYHTVTSWYIPTRNSLSRQLPMHSSAILPYNPIRLPLRWAEWLHIYLYTTVIINFTLVTAIYWPLLSVHFPRLSLFGKWVDASQHGANLIVAILEFSIGRMNATPGMVFLQLVTLVAYMFLAWIYHCASGIWVYEFMDLSVQPRATLFYLGLTVGDAMIGTLWVFAHWMRNRLIQRWRNRRNSDSVLSDNKLVHEESLTEPRFFRSFKR